METPFRSRTGRHIHDVYGLSLELAKLDDKEFAYHVNEHRNDVHEWLEKHPRHSELAKDIKHVLSRKKMVNKIQNYLLSTPKKGKHGHEGCQHTSNCIKCGAIEFAIGLTTGVVVGLMVGILA